MSSDSASKNEYKDQIPGFSFSVGGKLFVPFTYIKQNHLTPSISAGLLFDKRCFTTFWYVKTPNDDSIFTILYRKFSLFSFCKILINDHNLLYINFLWKNYVIITISINMYLFHNRLTLSIFTMLIIDHLKCFYMRGADLFTMIKEWLS
jgi:hypothetical protein